MRIVFMGTPAFAVASLDKLYKAGYEIAGVITAPDKPAGRGLQLTESAVKTYARENGLPVLQPEKLKEPQFLEKLRSLQADVQVVVAFRMLPEVVWNMPPLGTINLHASLLPQYRGAAPINRAIINGETETGVTTFKLQHEIDTGNILLQQKIPITETDTAGTVHDKLMDAGSDLLLKTITGLDAGNLLEKEQPSLISEETELHHAPKIFSEDCEINWNDSVTRVYNFIRGLSPYPAAYTYLEGRKLKIYSCRKEFGNKEVPAGELISDRKTFLKFATEDGYIVVTELQLAGKRKMAVSDFLRGWRKQE